MTYLINESIDNYRWISPAGNDKDWGLQLARLRGQTLPQTFGPVDVEWTSETRSRAICDFPNFYSNFLCLSNRALSSVGSLLDPFGQWIKLDGLEYTAFYCLNTRNMLDEVKTREALDQTRFASFHSPEFIPILKHRAEPDEHVFRLPESISKFFVSERFKDTYIQAGLTGLEFNKVPCS